MGLLLSMLPQGFTSDDLAMLRKQRATARDQAMEKEWEEWRRIEAPRQMAVMDESTLKSFQEQVCRNNCLDESLPEDQVLITTFVQQAIEDQMLTFADWKKTLHSALSR